MSQPSDQGVDNVGTFQVGKKSAPAPGARRERELYRYAGALVDIKLQDASVVAVSSRSLALTAYAQLVTLRLNGRRALICLYDKQKQYIVAEATRTLSLQQDSTHDPGDSLYFGTNILDRRDDFFKATLRQHKNRSSDDGQAEAFVVRDLREDEHFSSHPLVAGGPRATFYAGVPLITPNGSPVGTLSLLDDKPRLEGLSDVESRFMRDIATTIVSHLEMARTTKAHKRGMRMVKALSRFTEGKDSIEDNAGLPYSSTGARQASNAAQTADLEGSARTMAYNATGNAERLDDEVQERLGLKNRRVSRSFEPKQLVQTSTEEAHSKTARDSPTRSPERDLQEELLSRGVRKTFQRAASMINEALEMSGTILLDASVGEFGRLRSSSKDTTSSSEAENPATTDPTESEDNVSAVSSRLATPTGTDNEGTKSENAKTPVEMESKVCRQLGSAYNPVEMADSERRVVHQGMSERFLKLLLKNYPYGKIWHFDSDGQPSSGSDLSDDSFGLPQHRQGPERKRKPGRRDHGARIQKLFPGARALAIMPIWDASRERFFACTVTWTYSPLRILSFNNDLGYLCAFCDCLMAEAARLDVQQEVKFKNNFMSTISHELRSPLHGILGGVEVLQDRPPPEVQDDILQMIGASGKSLLEIIDHLLEHATETKKRESALKSKRLKKANPGHSPARMPRGLSRRPAYQPTHDIAEVTEELMDGLFWATAEPAHFLQPGVAPLPGAPLKAILDIDPTNMDENGWKFHVDAVAWRRILNNLINNSIKFTDAGGFMKISLSIRPSTTGPEYMDVTLVATDTGRGMSRRYQQYGLWQHFSQENIHARGTGLGLRLVRNTVEDMGGDIEVKSSLGTGTVVKVVIPLPRGGRSSSPSSSSTASVGFDRIRNCSFTLLGFEDGPDDNQRAKNANEELRSSVTFSLQHLGLRLAEEQPDLQILTESLARHLLLSEADSTAFERPTIVLCHSIASTRTLAAAPYANVRLRRAVIVAQPLGPRKLFRALKTCFEGEPKLQVRTGDSNDSKDEDLGVDTDVTSDSGPASAEMVTPNTKQQLGSLMGSPAGSRRSSRSGDTASAIRHQSDDEGEAVPTPQLGPSVLLVDDNHLNLVLLQAFMRKLKRPFTSAVNGLEAVEAYSKAHSQTQVETASGIAKPPDTVLMDITMPVMDGLEATRQIRAYERQNGIEPAKMIAITAMGTPQAEQEAFSSGIDLFLTKPVRLNKLTELMNQDFSEHGKVADGSDDRI